MLAGRGYAVPESRIIGGPSWADSERYDIEAKAPAGGERGALQPMLQGMLEDRFQLKVHKETRELPVYELVVAKGGSKMKLSEDQTPPPPPGPLPLPERGAGPRGDPAAGARGPIAVTGTGAAAGPAFGRGPLPRGSSGRGSINGRNTFQGTAIPVSAMVTGIQGQLDRPVVDKTGLMGLFDIKLEWTPGAEQPPGPFGPNPNAPPPAPPEDAVSIFTAVQEQLGLRLESAKGPLEVIVIDSAQKPTEN
jgi:uncharacterized protein (TIGR03435 family)